MKPDRLPAALLLLILLPFCFTAAAKGRAGNAAPTRVLIVAPPDNIKSNYFHEALIAEKTGLDADSVDEACNAVIAGNIVAASGKSPCSFVAATSSQSRILAEKIRVSGEGEESISDVTQIGNEEWREMLAQSDAQYMLVLDQHYIKRQGEPMRTVFYIISYSLYDKDKKKIYTDNQYFTLMDLVPVTRIRELSRKTSSRIAAGIEKSIGM